jgi:hypothetical protein
MLRPVLLISAAVLAGCTTATSTKMISSNSALITTSEIGGSEAVVKHRALKLAARTALDHGFDFFGVLSKQVTNAADSDSWSGAIGGGNPNSPMRHVYREPSIGLQVQFLRASELPADRDGIYSASAVLAPNHEVRSIK